MSCLLRARRSGEVQGRYQATTRLRAGVTLSLCEGGDLDETVTVQLLPMAAPKGQAAGRSRITDAFRIWTGPDAR